MDLPRAILFDMDGTITQPMLDFAQIRAEMGVGDRPLLEAMDEMNAQARAFADQILARHENLAARNSQLNPGCQELLQWLANRQIPTGLVTRNSRRNVVIVLDRHSLAFGALVCREDSPYKPDPAPLLLACRRLDAAARAIVCSHDVTPFPSPCTQGEGKGGGFVGQLALDPHPNPPPEYMGREKGEACDFPGVLASDTWMVGDGQYDVEAGAAAKMRTIWISHGKSRWFTAEPWKTVTHLHEVLELLHGGSPCARQSQS